MFSECFHLPYPLDTINFEILWKSLNLNDFHFIDENTSDIHLKICGVFFNGMSEKNIEYTLLVCFFVSYILFLYIKRSLDSLMLLLLQNFYVSVQILNNVFRFN